MDLNAAFKITAGVTGQSALDKLNATVGQVAKGVDAIPGVAKAAGLALAGMVAGVGIAGLKGAFDGVVESINRIGDAADKTGASVEAMSALANAATITGDEFGKVEGAMVRLSKALAGTDDESKGAAKGLAAIGLSMDQLQKLSPDEQLYAVAKAMDQFEDGTGKTAVALSIFGKAGADMLPFLKDYAEIGPQAATVTQEMKDQAEAYSQGLGRLSVAQQAWRNQIVGALLPSATAFVGALTSVMNGTDGVRQGQQKLAADNGIASWADAGIKGLTYVISAGEYVIRLFRVMGEAVAASAAQISALFGGVFDAMQKLTSGDFGGAWEALKDGGKRYASIGVDFAGQVKDLMLAETMGERLRAQFEQNRRGAVTLAGDSAPKGNLNGFKFAETGGKAAKEVDLFADALNNLNAEQAKLDWQVEHIAQYDEKLGKAREATIRFEVEQGRLKGLSEGQKAALIMQAEAVDQLAERLRVAKVAQEVTNQTKAIEANTAALGLSAQARELAAFAQDLENKGVKAGTEEYNRLYAARQQALQGRDAAKGDPILGFKDGLNKIAEQGASVAESISTTMTDAFNKASSALADFVTTGKANFSDLARSILSDLAKIIIQKQLAQAVDMATKFFGFADGGAFDRGGVKAFASGGVVSSPTLFKFAQGGQMRNGLMGEAGPEAIMPLRRGPDGRLGVAAHGGGGGGSNVQVNVTVNNDGSVQTDAQQAGRLGASISAAVQAEIMKQRRPGGLLFAS